jgi:hypothetical protein
MFVNMTLGTTRKLRYAGPRTGKHSRMKAVILVTTVILKMKRFSECITTDGGLTYNRVGHL